MGTGMHHGIISGNDPWGLPLHYKIMPQYLQTLASYRTHMVGKWHLGHFTEVQTPLERGFDTLYGYFSGFEGYFEHTAEVQICADEHDCFYDLRDNWTPVRSDTYNTYLFSSQVETLISHYGSQEEDSDPFFLYYALSNMHEPIQVPLEVKALHAKKLAQVPNDKRRTFAAMAIILDEAVGNMTDALQAYGLYEDTFIIVASDNGALPLVEAAGSNWPLRGAKGSLWEGGVKVNAFVRSSLIPDNRRGMFYDGLFHVTDWLPTIVYGVLGESESNSDSLDGVNQWDAIIGRAEAPRNSLLYNIDYNGNITFGALRIGDLKILRGVQYYPVWPVPQGDALAVNQSNYANEQYLDYLFNATADPTESVDLKESH